MRRRLVRRLGALRSVMLRLTRTLLLYAIVAGLSLAAGVAVVALYTEYGYHPIRNAATWAGQPARFAIAGSCTACHAREVAAVAGAPHAGTNCQSCHGALADHVRDSTATLTLASTARASEQAATACIICHERVSGRPATFPQVTQALHFGPAPCLLCHDAHTTTALVPPVIPHSLDRLPECVACHGPDGLRPVSDRHPVWPDGECLTCHLRRGGSDE